MKSCKKCLRDLPVDMYWGRHARCKDCMKEESRARGPEGARRSHLKTRYGITVEQYDMMLASQGGSCASCKRIPEDRASLHIDHDHACCPGRKSCGGCLRGILCNRCNMALGLLDDDIEKLRSLEKYLTAPRL